MFSGFFGERSPTSNSPPSTAQQSTGTDESAAPTSEDPAVARAYSEIWAAPTETIKIPWQSSSASRTRLEDIFPDPFRPQREEKIESGEVLFHYTPSPFVQLVDHMIGAHKGERLWDPRRERPPHLRLQPMFGLPAMTREEWLMHRAMESCAFKAAFGFVGGGVVGGGLALFTFGVDPTWSMRYAGGDPTKVPTLKETWRELRSRLGSYSKSMAMLGLAFGGVDCVLETWRGRTDWKNATASGAIVGFAMGARAGLKSGVLGGLGFAAFSTIIDFYMIGRG